jgi:hypothetical protein
MSSGYASGLGIGPQGDRLSPVIEGLTTLSPQQGTL